MKKSAIVVKNMRRHHEAASAATVLWVLAGVPAAIAWTQAIIQKISKRP